MGNIPDSMKGLPDSLNENQYVEITSETGEKFYVHPRPYINTVSNSILDQFSPENLLFNSVGIKNISILSNTIFN